MVKKYLNKCLQKTKGEKDNQELKDQDQWNADDKPKMSCFMVKNMDPQFSSNTSAQDGKNKQGGLGYTPAMISGTRFIDSENDKCDHIDG